MTNSKSGTPTVRMSEAEPERECAAAYGGVLTVDVSAVVRNYHALAAEASGSRTAAVLKADAYGLGARRVAPVLYDAGCRTFFVAHVDEGRDLRAHLSLDADILVLHGPPPGTEPDFEAHALTPVLNCGEQLRSWARFTSRGDVAGVCALQFDTGMTRFGFPLREAGEVQALLSSSPKVRVDLIMSHLACGDEPGNPHNRQQLDGLLGLRERFPGAPLSIAASSGIFLGRDFHLDLVRPGAALYGVRPVPAGPNPMAPVVRLQGRVMQLRDVAAGTGVGYGLTSRPPEPTRLATVGVGYADGYLRSASDRASAWLGDRRLPVVGRVSMDSIVVDVGDVPRSALAPGSLVDLICERYGVDDLAADAGTIGYEVLTSIGDRYWRDYVAA